MDFLFSFAKYASQHVVRKMILWSLYPKDKLTPSAFCVYKDIPPFFSSDR